MFYYVFGEGNKMKSSNWTVGTMKFHVNADHGSGS